MSKLDSLMAVDFCDNVGATSSIETTRSLSREIVFGTSNSGPGGYKINPKIRALYLTYIKLEELNKEGSRYLQNWRAARIEKVSDC